MHFVGGIFPVFQNFFFVRIVAPGLWGVRQRRGCGFCFGDSSECPARPSGREGLASASPLRRPLRHRRRAKGAALSRVPAGRAHRPSRGPRPRPPARRPVPGAGALCARVDRPAGQGPLSFTHVRAVLSKRETCGSCSLLVNLWILQDRG